ncbi:MAG: transporter [Candidatus Cryptobacteroides sp.]
MNKVKTFIKDWMLPLAMVVGASAYLIYMQIPAFAPAGPYLYRTVAFLQPTLLFFLLFLTFCRISPKDMRPRKWHLWLLLFQTLGFILLAVTHILLKGSHSAVLIESAMLMIICPTATAASVITGKLGGDMPGLTTYLILINLVTAIVVPLFVPVIRPMQDTTFVVAFSMIMAKVFPLLICPCILAWIVRFTMPRLHRKIVRHENLPFNIWAVNLMLAILMTTRSIVHSDVPAVYQIGIAVVSLLCCIVQFASGKLIGRRYGASITAGQSLGQKNTVFAIWMGYTFMTPVTSIAGGFYSIWHNVFNSWQLYRKRRNDEEGIPSVRE